MPEEHPLRSLLFREMRFESRVLLRGGLRETRRTPSIHRELGRPEHRAPGASACYQSLPAHERIRTGRAVPPRVGVPEIPGRLRAVDIVLATLPLVRRNRVRTGEHRRFAEARHCRAPKGPTVE